MKVPKEFLAQVIEKLGLFCGTDGEIIPVQAGYDQWSAIYDGEDNPLVALEERFWFEISPSVTGKCVLDIGSGTGRRALEFHKQGARVTAMDFSPGMLEKFHAKPGAGEIKVVMRDIQQPFPFKNGQFDVISACLVLEHIPELLKIFHEIKRVCTPDGCVLISILHPAMYLLGIDARFSDPTTGESIRPQSALHSLGNYVEAANQAGLYFEILREYVVDEKLAEISPRAAKYLGWPLLVLMKLLQVPSVRT